MTPVNEHAFQKCIHPDCGQTYSIGQVLTACPACRSLLDINYDWDQLPVPKSLSEFEARWSNRRNPLDFSGVWRFRELLPFARDEQIVTIGEGQTILQQSNPVGRYVGVNDGGLHLQYEGLNPSGSFKDNGMTAASTHAHIVGAKIAACASTGNTSASLAIYASTTRIFKVVVFIGSGKIAYGKLSQALDYDARTLQIVGDFDDALARVREVSGEKGIYLCNSVNPFRLEGQKSIMYRVLEALAWEPPDWIVVPGGNLGNSSSFGKAFLELKQLGLISRIPRLAVINAAGANTLYRLYEQQGLRWNDGRPNEGMIQSFYGDMTEHRRRASTLASAIEINRPVNLEKCLRALDICDGVVREVGDQEILDAKAQVGAGGFGCEPASAASVAGAKLLREEGMIAPSDRVVCILTGHQLKDPTATVAYHSADVELFDEKLGTHGVKHAPYANRPVVVDNDLQKIIEALGV
ncbi:MAG: threonine synthase [Planctomycetales bacterium 12-60-4]|nr:MAG: threonine synthase [Planctomycetales bacterium 12-60-4]